MDHQINPHNIIIHTLNQDPTFQVLSSENPANKTEKSKRKDSKGIQRIKNRLNELDITYASEVTYSHCRAQRELPFDVQIIVNGRIGIIEYDGKQHFEATSFGGSMSDEEKQDKLRTQQSHDIVKNRFTKKHEISLLRISYRDDDYIEKMVDQFIVQIKSGKRVDMFSNSNDYENPYGKELDTGCIIQ